MLKRWIGVVAIGLVLGCLTLPSTINAQTRRPTIRVSIPFPFSLGNRTLPSGRYLISTMQGSLIELRNEQTGKTAMSIAPPEVNDSDKNDVLVFSNIGGRRVLTDIFDDAMNVSIPTARRKGRIEHASLVFLPIR